MDFSFSLNKPPNKYWCNWFYSLVADATIFLMQCLYSKNYVDYWKEEVRAKKKYFLVKSVYSWDFFLWFWALLLLFRERRRSWELLWWERRKIIVIPEECSSCHNYWKAEVQDFQKHCLQWEPYTKVKNGEVLSAFIFFSRRIYV